MKGVLEIVRVADDTRLFIGVDFLVVWDCGGAFILLAGEKKMLILCYICGAFVQSYVRGYAVQFKA